MLRRNRTDDLPAAIEIEIISRLYEALPQIMCIAAGLTGGTAIMAVRTGDPVLWMIFAAAVLTSAIRLIGIRMFHRRKRDALTLAQAHRWEDAYAWPAFAFTGVIAALTIRIFHAGYVDGYILTVGLTMALTAGSSARTIRFWICATLSTAALGTLVACMMLTGDLLLQSMGLLLALYLYSVFESSAHIVRQIEAVLVAERELDIAARRDALTGIANRRAFDEILSATCGRPFALLMLDLDGFKAVNDGSAMLPEMTSCVRLRNASRASFAAMIPWPASAAMSSPSSCRRRMWPLRKPLPRKPCRRSLSPMSSLAHRSSSELRLASKSCGPAT